MRGPAALQWHQEAGSLLPYWLLFSFFAVGALNSRIHPAGAEAPKGGLLLFGAIVTALLIGLRQWVGADWRTYEFLFDFAAYRDLGAVLEVGDPGYQFVNWAVQRAGGELWVVNLLCAAIFVWGLLRLVRNQPAPWLAFLVAIPYLVIVVAMGYTRQAVAIGILMAGLASLGRGASILRFAVYMAFAALFHKTAVIALPIVIFAGQRNRLLNAIAGIAMFVLLYDLFLADSVENFVENYITAEYSSQGAAIRVAMNIVPALIVLIGGSRLGFTPQEEKIWRYFSYAAVGMVVLLVVLPSSTAVDRMALYIMPLQVVVLSRAFVFFGRWSTGRLVIVAYLFAIQFVWLNFAQHARFWVPYQSVFEENESGRSLRKKEPAA